MMGFEDCFRILYDRLKTEIIVTSAGNTSELWWRGAERANAYSISKHR